MPGNLSVETRDLFNLIYIGNKDVMKKITELDATSNLRIAYTGLTPIATSKYVLEHIL